VPVRPARKAETRSTAVRYGAKTPVTPSFKQLQVPSELLPLPLHVTVWAEAAVRPRCGDRGGDPSRTEHRDAAEDKS
jgi:hypothetical protein